MVALKVDADTAQQILTALIDLKTSVDILGRKIDALEARVSSLEFKVDALEARVSSLEFKVDALEARVSSLEFKVDALGARVSSLEVTVGALTLKVDSLETSLSDFKKEVKVEFKDIGDGVRILEKKVTMIESRQIDVEQRLISMAVHTESRFYSLEVLLDKTAEPISAKNKNLAKAKNRING